MSLDKAIKWGKEHRKQFIIQVSGRDSNALDKESKRKEGME